MRVVHLAYSLSYGGIETMLVGILNEQARAADVTLVLLNRNDEHALLDSLVPEVEVRLVNRPVGSKNPLYLLRLWYVLRSLKPNVVHVHFPNIMRFLLPGLRGKLVFTMHHIPLPEDLPYLRRYARIYSISHCVQKTLAAAGYSSTVVYNGIRPERFLPHEFSAGSVFRIVQVGRMVHEIKGQDLLIEACSRLIYEDGHTEIRLDFIGDGASLPYLRGLVAEKELGRYVRFLGAQPPSYIENHLKDYDLFVQPSRWEGFGLTVAEAMAAKVPVLVSDREGPMEVIGSGAYGFHFPSGDVEQCAAAIRGIMQRPDREALAEKAYRHVAELFDVRRTAREYLEKYRESL